jgi:electron transport complex protein RnfG
MPALRAAAATLTAAACLWLGGLAEAQSLLSREQALALAFPGATFAAEQIFLTNEQVKEAAARAGGPLPSAIIARYTATLDGAAIGRAYVDTHVVRTKRETALVSIDANGRVKRVDVIAFLEPPEYKPPQAFLNQFGGRKLDDDLRLQRAVRPIAGATLTAGALTTAVRRVLAIDAVLASASTRKAQHP